MKFSYLHIVIDIILCTCLCDLKYEVGFIASQFNASEGDGYVNVTVALLFGVLRNEVQISITTDSSDAMGKF